MITEALLRKELADLEKEYVDYLIEHFADWEVWAKASQRVADREVVNDEEIPKAFRTELKITRVIVEMLDLGKFDWNDPKVRAIFKELTEAPFYRLFGNIITRIALRLAELAGVKTFLEIGAGKANLTGIMLQQMVQNNVSIPLITTDSQPIILENMAKLKAQYPKQNIETLLWDITSSPPTELLEKVQAPTLLYERYTLNYANLTAVKNIAKAVDIVVLGDWFNYTGALYAYDDIFQKIGAKPMFYKDIKPILDECFPNQYIFDQRAVDTIKLPNISMLIAWK